MISSGTTAIATGSDAAVTLLAGVAGVGYDSCTVVNEGSVAGFFSVDGGTTWARLPAGPCSVTVPLGGRDAAPAAGLSVKAKRVAGGSDVTGLWAWAA